MLRHRPSEIEEYRADLRSLCHDTDKGKQEQPYVPVFRQCPPERPAALFRRDRTVSALYR